jgi:hypothetical protein
MQIIAFHHQQQLNSHEWALACSIVQPVFGSLALLLLFLTPTFAMLSVMQSSDHSFGHPVHL